jgi:hypothetical protein
VQLADQLRVEDPLLLRPREDTKPAGRALQEHDVVAEGSILAHLRLLALVDEALGAPGSGVIDEKFGLVVLDVEARVAVGAVSEVVEEGAAARSRRADARLGDLQIRARFPRRKEREGRALRRGDDGGVVPDGLALGLTKAWRRAKRCVK